MFDPSVPEKTALARIATDAEAYESTRLAGLDDFPDPDSDPDAEAEIRRLQVLNSYNLVDTEPEPAYDDIVKMATLICGTPVAMVTLITEDRQWFKARVGMEPQETPRDQAFCAHAIRDPSRIMEVQDASQDPRFMHNPMVVGDPGIRFYAGAPLLSPSGVALGTVCVVDRVARELTPAMEQGLQALARQAGELLALRRANADLEILNQTVMEMQVELEQHQVKLEGENADLTETHPVDALTGLINQRTFERLMVEELRRAERSQTSLALLLADIDQLQTLARDFGQVAADNALRRVAKAFKAQARTYDTLASLDSRRFAVLLPGTEGSELAGIAARLGVAVAQMPPVGRALRLSVGVAVARFTDEPLDILERASMAIEQALTQGGNQVVVAPA